MLYTHRSFSAYFVIFCSTVLNSGEFFILNPYIYPFNVCLLTRDLRQCGPYLNLFHLIAVIFLQCKLILLNILLKA